VSSRHRPAGCDSPTVIRAVDWNARRHAWSPSYGESVRGVVGWWKGARVRDRVIVVAFVIVGIVVVAGFASGGDPGHDRGQIRILNDTNKTVVIWRCKDEGCRDLIDRWAVQPGGGGRVNVSDRGVPNPFLLRDVGTERQIGCLPLVMPKYREHVVARVSRRVPCESHYDTHVAWPPN
jgi:hypothetical protein